MRKQDRVKMHLEFCRGYRAQIALDRANHVSDKFPFALKALKNHQRKLLELRLNIY